MSQPQYEYTGVERRSSYLSDSEMEAIVERVAERVMARFYENIGKNVVTRMLIYIGIFAAGIITAVKSGLKIGF